MQTQSLSSAMEVGVGETASVFVTDGAMGTLLECWGVDFGTVGPMWSSSALLANTALVQRVHQAYVDAGCEVLKTCTYQLYEEGCTESGVVMEEVVDCAVRIARQTIPSHMNNKEMVRSAGSSFSEGVSACSRLLSSIVGNESERSVLLAGSLGPYGASLPGGHEYRGDYIVDDSIIEVFHAKRLAAFVGRLDGKTYLKVDFLLLETFPRLDEALGILSWMKREETLRDAPICFSFVVAPVEPFSVEDADDAALDDWWRSAEASVSLPDGHSFEDALTALQGRRVFQLAGFGSNCASPLEVSLVASAMLKRKRGRTEPSLALLLCPNSGEKYADGQWQSVQQPTTRSAVVVNAPLQTLQMKLARGEGGVHTCAEFVLQLLDQRHNADDWLFNVVLCGACCRSNPDDIAIIKSICRR